MAEPYSSSLAPIVPDRRRDKGEVEMYRPSPQLNYSRELSGQLSQARCQAESSVKAPKSCAKLRLSPYLWSIEDCELSLLPCHLLSPPMSGSPAGNCLFQPPSRWHYLQYQEQQSSSTSSRLLWLISVGEGSVVRLVVKVEFLRGVDLEARANRVKRLVRLAIR